MTKCRLKHTSNAVGRLALLATLSGSILCALCTAVQASNSPWHAEAVDTWRFPDSMKVQSVKAEFGAVGDGVHDDTEALRKAFDRRGAFVYLPNGTYLVRDRLQYTSGPSVGPTIVGESRDGVIIKLAADAEGFDDPDRPRAVVRLIRDGKVSADYFKICLHNLTIDTGRHRGATALMFYANNNGTCRNVRLVGKGAVGLDLSYMLNGPLLVSNVEIEGFDIGVKAASGPYNSQTFEHIVLKDQQQWGIHNQSECLSIRSLHSTNACPAVFARGNTVLLDSELAGGSGDNPAVICAGRMFVRNLRTSGYAHSLEQRSYDRDSGLGDLESKPLPAGRVSEWTSSPGRSLFVPQQPAKSLNLPVEEAPYQPLEKDLTRWVCVDDFGADGFDRQDDTAAIKKAIEYAAKNHKTVLSFAAQGKYIAGGELVISGSINRLQGARSYLVPPRRGSLRIIVKEGPAEVVTFSLLDRPLGRHDITIENASARTLVINHFRTKFTGSGPGKTFIEDACSNITVTNPKHRVWVRQLNSEGGDGPNNHNKGGDLWVLGLKTERDQTSIRTTDAGRTEVLGGWIYVTSREAPSVPLFEVIDSQASFAAIHQWNYRGNTYPVMVDADRNGRTVQLTRQNNQGRASFCLCAVE